MSKEIQRTNGTPELFSEEKEGTGKSTCLEGNTERSFDRRALVLRLGGAAAATAAGILPTALGAEEPPSSPSQQIPGAPGATVSPVDSLIEAALAVSPATLSPEQRMDVRNGVRSLQQALADARKAKLEYDIEPAFVFLPEGRR